MIGGGTGFTGGTTTGGGVTGGTTVTTSPGLGTGGKNAIAAGIVAVKVRPVSVKAVTDFRQSMIGFPKSTLQDSSAAGTGPLQGF